MNIKTETKGCIYEELDNGIHKFVFTGQGDNGLDEMFAELIKLWAKTPSDQVLRYIIDTTKANQNASLTKIVRRFQKLERHITSRPAGRTAIIHNPGIILSLAQSFINSFAPKKDQSRFFAKDQTDQAIEWLSQV